MSNLDKAREWANRGENLIGVIHPDAEAAIEIIQSLPDKWVDAEKLERIIAGMNCCLEEGTETNFSDGFNEATTTWRDALEALLTPKLPTLADMTEKERKACRWMYAKVTGSDQDYVIADPGVLSSNLWRDDGLIVRQYNDTITPLTDSPKMKWPGKEQSIKEDPLPSGAWVDDGSSPLDAMKLLAEKWEEIDRLKPEEVPPNEPWLIEVYGCKAVGTRYQDYAVLPWSVAPLDGSFAADYMDSEVTLIHKLVAEPPALPEGMRLADHEEYGRVVTSPRPDLNGYYAIFRLDDGLRSGSSSEYVHSTELDFLDGEDNE